MVLISSPTEHNDYPACACASKGYVIGFGDHLYICIYVYIYVCDPNILNETLPLDLPQCSYIGA